MEMAVIALAMIGWARFGMSVETAIHALTGVALFAGAVLAAAVLAGVARAPAAPRGVAGRLARLGIRALPTTGLLMMATWVVFMDDNLRTREDAVWPFTRTAMWAFLAIAAIYVWRPPVTASNRLLNVDLALKVVLPGSLVVAALALPTTAGLSPWYVTLMLIPVLSVLMNIGIAVIPGISVAFTVKALEVTRDRGRTVAEFIGTRKSLLLWLVAAKLAVLTISWFTYRVLSPHEATLALTDFLTAFIAAAIAAVLMAVNARVSLSLPQHSAASRYTGVVLGGVLVFGFGLAMLLGVTSAAIVTRPWTLAGICLLLALGVATRRIRHRRWVALAYLGVTVLATVLAIELASRPAGLSTQFHADDRMESIRAAGAHLAVLALGLVMVWIIVSSIRSRQFGWLIYLGTVVLWLVVQSISRATGFSEVWVFDLMLTVVLAAAAVLFVVGFQRSIDSFEIVVALVGTLLLIEVPMITQFQPDLVAIPLAMLGVLSPGVALMVKAVTDIGEPALRSRGVMYLALTASVYTQLSAAVWLADLDVAQFADVITAFAQSALTIPLLLLLVAAYQRQAATVVDRLRD